MTLRLPGKPPTDPWRKTPAAALDYEIAQEMASALGRMGRALESALRSLAEFDAAGREPDPHTGSDRANLVVVAADALWQFIVQREACGLRDTAAVVRMYKVPRDVQARMGPLPPRR
ncbi:MAG TPA: DUF6665 family protein [Xanthobacteraceae bacterium]|nr:DUF6665 family protein [Xanthobacteraceae bacterium]